MINDTFCPTAWRPFLSDVRVCEKMQCYVRLMGILNGEKMYWGRKRKRIFTLTKQVKPIYSFFHNLISELPKSKNRWRNFWCKQPCGNFRHRISPAEYRTQHIFRRGSLRSPFDYSCSQKRVRFDSYFF